MEKGKELLPCPLCYGEATDLGHGINCNQCGLWLGDNSSAWIAEAGLSYRQRWNTRPEADAPKKRNKQVKE